MIAGEIDVAAVVRAWQQRQQRTAEEACNQRWRARRQRQIALDNALWCWRQAKTDPAERAAVLRELGAILIPYWEAKRQALQEGWAREYARRRGRR